MIETYVTLFSMIDGIHPNVQAGTVQKTSYPIFYDLSKVVFLCQNDLFIPIIIKISHYYVYLKIKFEKGLLLMCFIYSALSLEKHMFFIKLGFWYITYMRTLPNYS